MTQQYKGFDIRIKGDNRVQVSVPEEAGAQRLGDTELVAGQAAMFQTAETAKQAIDKFVGPVPGPNSPTLTSLDPAEAEIQSGDITIEIHGTGFTTGSILVWNGADDHAAFNSPELMTTVVKTSLSTIPSDCTVAVRNGLDLSNSLVFKLTEPET